MLVALQQEAAAQNPKELTGTLARKAGAAFNTVGAQFKVSFLLFFIFILYVFLFNFLKKYLLTNHSFLKQQQLNDLVRALASTTPR